MKTLSEPKVEIKNIKTFRGMEGYGLNATIYINSVKCLFAIDEGNGGEMMFDIISYPQTETEKNNIQLLLDYIDTLPEYLLEFNENISLDENNKPIMLKPNLESYINNKILEIEQAKNKAKFQNKMKKFMETSIVFGVPGSDSFQRLDLHKPLKDISLQALILYIKSIQKNHCTNGVVILNTNLEKLGVKL